MEKLVTKLRRKSTLRGNDFDYTIKRDGNVSPEPTVLISEFEINAISPEDSAKRVPRRPCRVQTLFPSPKPSTNKIIFHSPTIKNEFFGIDFSKSNSPNKNFSPRSASFSTYTNNIEKTFTPKPDLILHLFEENKEIPELSSSQEISIPEYEPKSFRKHKKKHSISFEIDKSELTILQQSPGKKVKVYNRDGQINEMKSEQTLETDKAKELKPAEIHQMRLRLKPCVTERVVMSFSEALKEFEMQNEVYIEANLWIKGVKDYFCCCFSDKNELIPEFLDICEKVIIFAYAGFDTENIFHSSLLISVFNSLQAIKCGKFSWAEVGFSSNNPYDKDLKHNVASFGLLLIMFLYEFIPSTLVNMLQYCSSIHLAFVPLAFDVAEIVLLTLRKKKLNCLMNQTQKCLEILCFFFAGCLVEWFSLHKEEMGRIRRVNEILETQAFKEPESFINLARNLLEFQI